MNVENESIKSLIHNSMWFYYYNCGYNRVLNLDLDVAKGIYEDEDYWWEDYEEDKDKNCEKCMFHTGIDSMFLDDTCILNRLGWDFDSYDFPVPNMELAILGEEYNEEE